MSEIEQEEQEWNTLFALANVQAGLSRLADAGETEEGG